MVLGLYVKPENIWISLLLYHCTMLLYIPTWIIVLRCGVIHTNLTQTLYWDCRKESCVSLLGLQNSRTLRCYLVNYKFWNWSKFTTVPCICSCTDIIINCYRIYFVIFSNPKLRFTRTRHDNITITMYPCIAELTRLKILDMSELNVMLYLDCAWVTVLHPTLIRKQSRVCCWPQIIGIFNLWFVVCLLRYAVTVVPGQLVYVMV